MNYETLVKADALALNLLSNVEHMKKLLSDALSNKVIDNEFYAHTRSCVQTLDLSIRGFKMAQEWEYRRSGGQFYQRGAAGTGVLRNK